MGVDQGRAQDGAADQSAIQSTLQGPQKKTYQQKRQEARERLQEMLNARQPQETIQAPLAPQTLQSGFNPAVNYTLPNYANSPNLRKFVDSLPGLGIANANNLGQYIPVAVPDTTTYPGSDYYEIGLAKYRKQMHSDLPVAGTMLRGYYQINSGTSGTTDQPNSIWDR